MEEMYIHLAAIISVVIFLGLAVFQVLLSLGLPLGEATMGGYHKILPKQLRFFSAVSAVILLFMGCVFLQRSNVVSFGFTNIFTNISVWVVTAYLALNTIVNLLSKSKKERLIMTPLSSISFILCLIVAISSK